MKTFTKIILTALLGVSLLQGAAFEKVAKSRATQIMMSSEKPLSTGNNTILLEVGHKNYKDSTMKVKVFMPAMPGMPYMESITDAKSLGNGKFTTNVNISMGGTWQVHIFLTPKTGKKVRAKTSLNI
ncbi:MAG: hypothetical protein ACI9TV_000727 [Sulfurimonas sp.]|jgi:hypothetical protein|uniref:FixH family protein n=1 Tax=Sulfurimonas sp. TaxID=2022749 RepID=UPI0039E5FFC7